MFLAFIAVETGLYYNQALSSVQVPPSYRKDSILYPPVAALQGPSTPVVPEVQGYRKADTMPVNCMSPQLHSISPPSHPLQLGTAQSKICWTERRIYVPPKEQIALAASRTWTAVSAQQEPQAPWQRIGPDMFVQSISVKFDSIGVVLDVVEVVEEAENEDVVVVDFVLVVVVVVVEPEPTAIACQAPLKIGDNDNFVNPPLSNDDIIVLKLFGGAVLATAACLGGYLSLASVSASLARCLSIPFPYSPLFFTTFFCNSIFLRSQPGKQLQFSSSQTFNSEQSRTNCLIPGVEAMSPVQVRRNSSGLRSMYQFQPWVQERPDFLLCSFMVFLLDSRISLRYVRYSSFRYFLLYFFYTCYRAIVRGAGAGLLRKQA